MRFARAFNSVLAVIAFRWQELRDLIDGARAPAAEGPGRNTYRLTDFEFVLVQRTLHHVK